MKSEELARIRKPQNERRHATFKLEIEVVSGNFWRQMRGASFNFPVVQIPCIPFVPIRDDSWSPSESFPRAIVPQDEFSKFSVSSDA